MLYNEDCLIGLDEVADKSIDLVVMDPPYEFTPTGGGELAKRPYNDEIVGLSEGISDELLDKIVSKMKKINIYIFCNKAQIKQYLDYFDGCNFDLLTWHKTNPIPTCKNKYLSDTEYLLFFRDEGVKLYGTYESKKKYYVSSKNTEDKNGWGHPTIKPLNIINNLIINSSQPGDLVMDPFMGSGTTAVSCIGLGREYVGFEMNEEYYDICMKRIQGAKSNTSLNEWY